MGLATEVGKLDVNERRQVIEWVGEDINGRVPYAVTVGEGSVSGQIAFDLSSEVANAIQRAMAKDPNQRFALAGEFVVELS